MGEYSEDILHKLWDYELSIYNEFARVCEKYGFRYFASYGTVIGAMRHRGFIPWDDDMDVGMPREDYEKFLEVAPKELGSTFELLEARKTKVYVLPFAKLTRSDTTFIEATDTDRKYHSGIFIDIFPFDKVPEDAVERQKIQQKCWVIARLMVLCDYPKPKLPSSVKGFKKQVAYFGCYVVHVLLLLFGQSAKKLQSRYTAVASKYGKEHDTNRYAEFMLYKYEDNYGKEDVTYSEEELLPAVDMQYETQSIKVPQNSDVYLKKTYGEYMTLPPVEKRHCHFPAVLKFDE